MATGDQNDITLRLYRWLPTRWFPSGAGTLVYAVISGFAGGLAAIYAIIAYAGRQMRIATATDGWLDLISGDYFGTALPRLPGEADPAFSVRIRREILRERVTREAIDRVIFDTTGNHPTIVEADRTSDIGCWRQGFAWHVGRYGSRGLPFQVFVTTPRQNPVPFPIMGGWRGLPSAWRGSFFTYSLSAIAPPPQPPDAAIVAAIESVRPAGITVWLQLTNRPAAAETVGDGQTALNQAAQSGFNTEMGMN
jgi:hypothetical protein